MSKKYLDLDGLEEVVEQINAKYAKLTDIPTTPNEVGALPATTKYGATLTASVNTSTYVCTFQLKDQDGNNLGNATTIDLPIESAIVNASYDNTTKDLTFTLQNGNTVTVPMDAIISGLQAEITSSNKLSADLVNDASTTNSFIKDLGSGYTNIWELASGVYKGKIDLLYYKTGSVISSGFTAGKCIIVISNHVNYVRFTILIGYHIYVGVSFGASQGNYQLIETLNLADTAITTAEIEALFA